MHATLGLRLPPHNLATGLSPSMVPRSSGLYLLRDGFMRAVQHHIHTMLPLRIRFALTGFQSPLLTGSQLLSFPPGTEMFQFPGFPPPCGGNSDIFGSTAACASPKLFTACHVLRRLSNQAIPCMVYIIPASLFSEPRHKKLNVSR
jgi:hypothetical protein